MITSLQIDDLAKAIDTLWQMLQDGDGSAVVVVPDEEAARLAMAPRRRGGPAATAAENPERRLAARFVTIGGPPAATPDGVYPFDALVVDETGAAIAIDLALLASNGVELPRRIPIGTRLFTPADVAAGGATQLAAGDAIIALLRVQHAGILTTSPATDEIHRIAFVQFRTADMRQQRVAAEAMRAAKRYPQIEFKSRAADGDLATQDAIVREFVADGFRAVLVSTDEPATIATVANEARERGVAVIVLDPKLSGEHGACTIGCDPHLIGRAAGRAVKQLLPAGGTVVELHGDLGSAIEQSRHRGLRAELGAP